MPPSSHGMGRCTLGAGLPTGGEGLCTMECQVVLMMWAGSHGDQGIPTGGEGVDREVLQLPPMRNILKKCNNIKLGQKRYALQFGKNVVSSFKIRLNMGISAPNGGEGVGRGGGSPGSRAGVRALLPGPAKGALVPGAWRYCQQQRPCLEHGDPPRGGG